jgi:hypothetical protein
VISFVHVEAEVSRELTATFICELDEKWDAASLYSIMYELIAFPLLVLGADHRTRSFVPEVLTASTSTSDGALGGDLGAKVNCDGVPCKAAFDTAPVPAALVAFTRT